MNEDKILSHNLNGDEAMGLLNDAMPTATRRIYRLMQSIHHCWRKSESIFLMPCFIPLTAR